MLILYTSLCSQSVGSARFILNSSAQYIGMKPNLTAIKNRGIQSQHLHAAPEYCVMYITIIYELQFVKTYASPLETKSRNRRSKCVV